MGTAVPVTNSTFKYDTFLRAAKTEHFGIVKKFKDYYTDVFLDLGDSFAGTDHLGTKLGLPDPLLISSGLILRLKYNVPFSELHSLEFALRGFGDWFANPLRMIDRIDMETAITAFSTAQFYYASGEIQRDKATYNICWSHLALNFDLSLQLLDLYSSPGNKFEKAAYFKRVLEGFLDRESIYYPINDYAISIDVVARKNIINFLEESLTNAS